MRITGPTQRSPASKLTKRRRIARNTTLGFFLTAGAHRTICQHRGRMGMLINGMTWTRSKENEREGRRRKEKEVKKEKEGEGRRRKEKEGEGKRRKEKERE
ncbi:hypothetical protein NHX12_023646 [Muraenolepis orangiensis]|uniref:Uncharacterized protein n=1 Tax=Muraenolepis orangiensis TaxID=630683 RepID=A0A9Q0EKJ6_9TELE|nr:hypothetical protein NHX12_023646 [Muraenolepis orangiensis]